MFLDLALYLVFCILPEPEEYIFNIFYITCIVSNGQLYFDMIGDILHRALSDFVYFP